MERKLRLQRCWYISAFSLLVFHFEWAEKNFLVQRWHLLSESSSNNVGSSTYRARLRCCSGAQADRWVTSANSWCKRKFKMKTSASQCLVYFVDCFCCFSHVVNRVLWRPLCPNLSLISHKSHRRSPLCSVPPRKLQNWTFSRNTCAGLWKEQELGELPGWKQTSNCCCGCCKQLKTVISTNFSHFSWRRQKTRVWTSLPSCTRCGTRTVSSSRASATSTRRTPTTCTSTSTPSTTVVRTTSGASAPTNWARAPRTSSTRCPRPTPSCSPSTDTRQTWSLKPPCDARVVHACKSAKERDRTGQRAWKKKFCPPPLAVVHS